MSISISAMGGTQNAAMMSGASSYGSPQEKMSNLASQIDTTSSGTITQSQFNQAFKSSNTPAVFKAAGANAVWNAIDTNGSGQVSRQTFVESMKNQMVQLRQSTASADAAQTSATGTQALNLLA